jgi:NAD-dependent deacetylase
MREPIFTPDDLLEQAAELLGNARHAVALTGAGISTYSGIPDFRSQGTGLWDAAAIDMMNVASLHGFRQNPEAFFLWVRPLAQKIWHANPNPAHNALAHLEAYGVIKAVITQNIDMLHSRAGSRALYEIHGHLREATCVECFAVYPSEEFLLQFLEMGEIPRCSACRGILKPNVILFGEAIPYQTLQDVRRVSRECDVMIVTGSSLKVAPAADLPVIAHAHGARLVLINHEPTDLDDRADVVIRDNITVVLPQLADLIENRSS